MQKISKTIRGFTLVEMIVSIGLFTIVLFVASSSFLTVINADRKSRTTRIAMDNLAVTLEDMTRRLRTGTAYECGGMVSLSVPPPVRDCLFGDDNNTRIAFTDQDGRRVSYYLDDGAIMRERSAGGEFEEEVSIRATSPEIEITGLTFFVNGSTRGDAIQPYVTIIIRGSTSGVFDSGFSLQTTVTQRAYDF